MAPGGRLSFPSFLILPSLGNGGRAQGTCTIPLPQRHPAGSLCQDTYWCPDIGVFFWSQKKGKFEDYVLTCTALRKQHTFHSRTYPRVTWARWQSGKTFFIHKHICSAAIHRQVPFVRSSETNWKVLHPRQTWSQGHCSQEGNSGHNFCQNSYPQHSTIWSARDSLGPRFSQGGKELVHSSNGPTFPKRAPQRIGFCLASLGALMSPTQSSHSEGNRDNDLDWEIPWHLPLCSAQRKQAKP